MSSTEPERGEIWRDADGSLLLYRGNDHWMTFGNMFLMTVDELVERGGVHSIPVDRVFDEQGWYQLGDDSVYPKGEGYF